MKFTYVLQGFIVDHYQLTVFLRVYSDVMLSSSSMVKVDKSRLQP